MNDKKYKRFFLILLFIIGIIGIATSFRLSNEKLVGE